MIWFDSILKSLQSNFIFFQDPLVAKLASFLMRMGLILPQSNFCGLILWLYDNFLWNQSYGIFQ
jgi:hypothetical protein